MPTCHENVFTDSADDPKKVSRVWRIVVRNTVLILEAITRPGVGIDLFHFFRRHAPGDEPTEFFAGKASNVHHDRG